VLLERISEAVAVVDATGVLRYASPAAGRLLGYVDGGFVGRQLLDLVHPDDVRAVAAELTRVAGSPGYSQPFRFRFRAASGDWLTLETTASNNLGDPDVRGLVITARDVTDQAQFEAAWRFASASAKALIRAESEEALLGEMCRVAVDEGGYVFAWVGYADLGPSRLVLPVASYGVDGGYLSAITVRWDDSPAAKGPAGAAIRTGSTHVVTDVTTDPSFLPWRTHAEAAGFRSVVGLPLQLAGYPPGVMAIYADEPEAFDPPAVEKLQELADDLAYGIIRLREADRLEHLLDQTIDTIAGMVEQRDPYTAGHERRVAQLAAAIAAELGIDEAAIRGISTAARIHDVGKIAVPAEILSKPASLSLAESELVKTHVQAGYDIVSRIDFPWPVAQMILQHHERIDGSGYPNGLHRDEIGIGARILAVADTVEAMASHRPYRPGLGIDAALDELRAHRGVTFDADVVDTCIDLFTSGRFTFRDLA
jgi:PAS domain S-box-containing protein/putative nucleotidyltransferase with HDIG domain